MEDIINLAASSYDYIRFTVVDLIGICRTKVLPKRSFVQALKSGTEVNAGVIRRGYDGASYSGTDKTLFTCHDNELLIPDVETLHPVPMSSTDIYKVGQVFCDVRPIKISPGNIYMKAPRQIAKMQLDRLHQLGLEFFSGFEIEVTIENEATSRPDERWNVANHYSMRAWLDGETVMLEADTIASEMGTKTLGMHFESRLGNYEIITSPQHGMKSVDNVIITKEVLHEVANKHGKRAVFLALPYRNAPVNSLHLNHSLRRLDDDFPVFYDDQSENKLSDTGKHWLAGLLKHQPALCGLFYPIENCYRAVKADPFMPRLANWGIDDRFCGIRVKQSTPERCYFEVRNAGVPCNAYVMMAGVIAAGLDGINNKLACPTMSHSQAHKLPTSSEEGLRLLEEDLILKEAFGEQFVDMFCKMKRLENTSLNPGTDIDSALANERQFYLHHL